MPSVFRRLRFSWTYVRPHRRRFVVGIAALLARDAIAIAIPLLIRRAVTILAEPHQVRRAAWIAATIVFAAIPKALLQAFARMRMMMPRATRSTKCATVSTATSYRSMFHFSPACAPAT